VKRILVALVLVACAGAATAAIPALTRITGAVAEANAGSGRVRPLLIDVTLRVAGGGAEADGVLATHPTGLARLELRTGMGFVERHLLQGDEYAASRDGELIDRPHPFLPPVFLLQSNSGASLAAALSSYGVAPDTVALGHMGAHDCYVLGGRRLGDVQPPPSLWVDMVTYEPVRIVRADGTEYRLGPSKVFGGGIQLPTWIEIRAPNSPRARLEVNGASKADAPAAAFQKSWLEFRPAAPEDETLPPQ
jgi:hypothetical protein